MRRSQGFTLIEMMVTIAILAIVTALAVPAMRGFIVRSQAAAAANSMLTAVAVARSEALRRGGPVSICPSLNGTSCATATAWNQGWLVFTDDGVRRTIDGTDQVIQAFDKPGGTPAFTQSITAITYLASGMREFGSGIPTGNCLELIVSGNEEARRYVHISNTGSTRTGKGACVQ